MADQQKPRFDVLGGSIVLKIILIAAIGLIISVFIFGLPTTMGDLFWSGVKIVVGIVLIVFILKGIQSAMKPKPFSPTESFKNKVIRIAEYSKPFNIKNLYLRGEDMRVYSKWGKVIGLLFIPYFYAKEKLDSNGHVLLEPKKDKDGKIIKDKDNMPIMVPQREFLTEKDGDWLFVTKIGFWIFGKKELVRAHHSICSAIGESTWIKDVNLVPIGDYFYPAKMWQSDIKKILAQHQSEAVLETHTNFLDLLSHVTQMSLGSDPNFQKIMLAQSEALTSRSAGTLIRD